MTWPKTAKKVTSSIRQVSRLRNEHRISMNPVFVLLSNDGFRREEARSIPDLPSESHRSRESSGDIMLMKLAES